MGVEDGGAEEMEMQRKEESQFNARHMSPEEQKRDELRARLAALSDKVHRAEQDVILEQQAQRRQRTLHQRLVKDVDDLRRTLLEMKKFEKEISGSQSTVEKAFEDFSVKKSFPPPRHKPEGHAVDEKENVSPTKAIAIRFDVEKKKVQQVCEDAIATTGSKLVNQAAGNLAMSSFPSLMEQGVLNMDHTTMLQVASNLADRKAQDIRDVMNVDNMYEASRQRMQSEKVADKMRSLLYYAHREHLASFEEGQALRCDAQNAQRRVESLIKDLESLHAKKARNDAEWRIQAISMKQDRDLSAAKTKMEVIQGRINEMKLKVRAHKQSSRALHSKHEQKKRLAKQEKDLRNFLQQLIAISKKSSESLCAAHARLLDAGRASLMDRANELEDMHIRVEELWPKDRDGQQEDLKTFLLSRCQKVKKVEEDGKSLFSGKLALEQTMEDKSFVHLVAETKWLLMREKTLEAQLAACQHLKDFVESSRSKPWNDDNYVHTLQTSLDALCSKWQRVVEEEILKSVRTGVDAIERSKRLEEMVQDWREQPAQFALPWVKVRGMNLQEWIHHLKRRGEMI
ncbi:hypothetical protein GUITHDRAFT_133982 [Guillardia theta CCMP2712]|uniref:Uncharacterized protein n=1 Tax=Guillardia theta (strain CCMP2712) TaxID=905079 RepID=L1JW26_GUITC|nr:hypothetical protein GUITHDRAFT_133982 [Guillardia theta CCMP2712]EKX52278.1 hypothetical protein GUITHDRAFT_133982 [Guillardia theta CCMP2712]|eukprot:XP_005839258.1 hypothetical protein GUITHDRAFT_133982 [Guillardia theta CCMP2712]